MDYKGYIPNPAQQTVRLKGGGVPALTSVLIEAANGKKVEGLDEATAQATLDELIDVRSSALVKAPKTSKKKD